jgi:hypothetical protein
LLSRGRDNRSLSAFGMTNCSFLVQGLSHTNEQQETLFAE